MTTEAERMMIKARTALLLSQPFFGTLALRLRLTEDSTIDTASVDGRAMRYNPDFVLKLTHAERVGLIAHETLHCAAGHPMRKGGREHDQFNVAADYAINPMVLDAGMVLPEGALVDPAYSGLSAEEIYTKRYHKRAPNNNSGAGDGENKPGNNFGGCGQFEQPKDPQSSDKPANKSELDNLKREWQVATMQAAAIAKKAGNMPGSVEELVESLRKSRIDWREALKRFVTTQAKQDYSWSPPNRRFIGQGIYLPSLRSEKIGDLVFAIDTSASMDERALAQALAELNEIVEEVQPERVHVVECDTSINHVTTFESGERLDVKTLHGRGGTMFTPVFEWVEDQQITPDCLIYFTDLCCYDFGPEPSYPVLWASTERATHNPFGEVIYVNADC